MDRPLSAEVSVLNEEDPLGQTRSEVFNLTTITLPLTFKPKSLTCQ